MNLLPKVSVLIPTYNQKAYIINAIESALNQDYENLEIIVSDDNSTDGSSELIEEFSIKQPKVNYFKNKTNLGRVPNYRKALYEYANGEYAVNLDGDDFFIDKSFISNAINKIYSYNCKIRPLLYTACKQIYIEKKMFNSIQKTSDDEICIKGIEYVLDLFSKYSFSHLATIYNRNVALSVDFYNNDIESTDQESVLRLALMGDVIVSKRIVGQWNQTGSNFSFALNYEKSFSNLKWIKIVSNELKKNKIGKLKLFIWEFKCKVVYSYPIIIQIFKSKKINIDFIKYLFRYNMTLPLLIKFISMFYKRYTK